MGVQNDWASFCFDRATATFGNALSNELDSVEGKNQKTIESKREQVLRKWIPDLAVKRKFKEPGKRNSG